ncbi:hypothetical protein CRUP_004097, partial [Coryphaenoides rupestris]
EVVGFQVQLAEVGQQKQRLEEGLRQRERELTALKGAGIEAERQRVNTSVRSLQQQLEDCRDESSHWMEQFHATKDELRTTKQECVWIKRSFEEELKEVQEKLSSMKQKIPDPSHAESVNKELSSSRANLQKVQTDLEKHRGDMDRKVMEVIALKKAHQEAGGGSS